MPWSVETVDIGRVGQYPSLVNMDGSPAILYAGRSNGSLKFARQVSGVWNVTTANASSHGFIGSTDAVGNLNGNVAVAYIDRQRVFNTTATSSVVYGTYDGERWVFETVVSDSFLKRFFQNTKIERTGMGDFIGWAERTGTNPVVNVLVAERGVSGIWKPVPIGATNSRTSWDMALVGTDLAVAYFDIVDRSIKYIQRAGKMWGDPQTIQTFSGNHSVTSISIADIEGSAHVFYQVNFGNPIAPGAQRRATNETSAWVEDVVEQPVLPSGFTDRGTSAGQLGFPAVAYHIRNRNNALVYARFVDDPVYGLDSWALEEVGINLAMPSLRFLGTTGYIAGYQIRTQVLVIATEVP